MEYAPTAIETLDAAIRARVPQAQLSGIIGNPATHVYGYHRSRNWDVSYGRDRKDDYSCVLPADQGGDGDAAAALDESLPPALMITVTKRLLAAAKARDPRLAAVREFAGTTNGTVTHSYDLATGHEGLGEWDDSHLWHIHLSFYRNAIGDPNKLLPIADVFAGIETAHGGGTEIKKPPTSEEDDDMKSFLARIPTNPNTFWLVRGDMTERVQITAAVAKNLQASGRYDSNPGLDNTTITNIPIAKK